MGIGGICGAVTGSFLVLGLWVGDGMEERQARYRTYDLVREFVKEFQRRRGTILCTDLLNGVDISTPEGREEAERRRLFVDVCPAYVEDAAEILEMIMGEERK